MAQPEAPGLLEAVRQRFLELSGDQEGVGALDVVGALAGELLARPIECIAESPRHGTTVSSVLAAADNALYRAKRAGGDVQVVYDAAVRSVAVVSR